MKNDHVYCEQILDSVEKVHEFVRGIDKDAFLKDRKTQSAVIMQLALIGELAKRVSDETKLVVNVPWKEISGFRDRAIHDYYQIDLQIAREFGVLKNIGDTSFGWEEPLIKLFKAARSETKS